MIKKISEYNTKLREVLTDEECLQIRDKLEYMKDGDCIDFDKAHNIYDKAIAQLICTDEVKRNIREKAQEEKIKFKHPEYIHLPSRNKFIEDGLVLEKSNILENDHEQHLDIDGFCENNNLKLWFVLKHQENSGGSQEKQAVEIFQYIKNCPKQLSENFIIFVLDGSYYQKSVKKWKSYYKSTEKKRRIDIIKDVAKKENAKCVIVTSDELMNNNIQELINYE